MDLIATKRLLEKFGVGDGYSPIDAELVHQSIEETHRQFGLIRLQLGALLLAVKYKELWRGKAKSFAEYLESEHIKHSAANQYMKVAEKLLFEVKLDNVQLMSISRISMTTLVKACDKITKVNADEVIDILAGLSDRDAKHALEEFESRRRPLTQSRAFSQKVRRMMSEFYGLPNDLRVEFLVALNVRKPEAVKFVEAVTEQQAEPRAAAPQEDATQLEE